MTLVLVGTDFSTRSDRALRRAALISRASGWSIHLLAVVDDDQPKEMVDAHVGEASAVLNDLSATMADHDGVTCRTEVRTGDPFIVLAQAAEEVMPAVLVLGPHRRQLLRDQFQGTTVERTLKRTRYPVIVTNGIPAGPYQRVVIAVDLEPYSRAGLKVASALPFVSSTERTVIYAYDAIADSMLSRSLVPGVDRAAYHEELAAEGLARLEAFLSDCSDKGTATVRPSHGSVPVAITKAAKSLDADLIVLTVSDRNALTKRVLGSTVEAVLRDADTDVLVVHPD